MLEGFSVGLLYSHYLQGQLKKIIIENLDEIDETLWLILDPKQGDIDIKTLVENFNYPNEDLEKIDLEWRTENY